jgi:hypothetical protein
MPSFFIPVIDNMDDLVDIVYPENSYRVCKIKIGDSAHTVPLYKSLFTGKPKAAFCLLIECCDMPCNEKELAGFIDYAISFTFNHKYLNLNFKTPFLLFKTCDRKDSAYISLFQQKCKDQGYNDIDYVQIDANNNICHSTIPGKWISLDSAENEKDLVSAYKEILRSNESPESFLLFFMHSTGQLHNLSQALELVENNLLLDFPAIYYLLQKNRFSDAKQRELQSEIGLLNESFDSLKSYYTFYNEPDTGYKRKINEIVDFYKNEYEILPLWYKRLGHVIKVLMGKRTFRSLFNDNVKKYKE